MFKRSGRGVRPYALTFLFLIVSCRCGSEATSQSQVILTNSQSSFTVTVEVADTDAKRSQGLMSRTSLAADAGMLFVFDQDVAETFWMKDTPLPLDIIFIGSDLKIISIAKNTTPFSEALISADAPYRYALEVNAGFSESHQITVGNGIVLNL
ncbi:MAG: DUF192 domain-containing protein [Deltaproteobacteria bacterium]|nr:DUF192 domain-containing protein [Deltaproteobacteria bacterium]